MHSTTKFSPSQIVYYFNALNPLDLLTLLVDERGSLDRNRETQVVKDLHTKVWQHIEKMNEQCAFKANKGRKTMVFKPGDWSAYEERKVFCLKEI